ncbi:MAG: hypothetical protein EPN40_12655 [Rhodanobacteraceae bacterium]|nr:MAG: hypothetical protein EPN40_12655 [Rhodanobacteraceae bacterium]
MNRLSELVSDDRFALAFRTRTPAPARPAALLVLLHGVGGNESNLANLADGVPDDTLVVLPRGRLSLGPDQYAWYRVAFTAKGSQFSTDEADASRRALITFVEQLQSAYGIAPQRTVIAGFSQGGILSASVALSAPESVRGFALLAARILPELEPVLAPRERQVHLHALVAHGRDDATLPAAWAQQADAWLERLGVAHQLRLYPGGHGIAPAMAADFHAWLAPLLAAPSAMARLELGSDATIVRGAIDDGTPLHLAPGVEQLVTEQLTHAPLVLAMENAIAAIEDELARVPPRVRGMALASDDLSLRAIATAAGVGTAPTITREAVEQVFARLSAVALGRPAIGEGLPAEPVFVATVLIVRELMHHLDIAAIHLEGIGRRADPDPQRLAGTTHAKTPLHHVH